MATTGDIKGDAGSLDYSSADLQGSMQVLCLLQIYRATIGWYIPAAAKHPSDNIQTAHRLTAAVTLKPMTMSTTNILLFVIPLVPLRSFQRRSLGPKAYM